MPKLVDLHPEWIDHDGRHGLGVAFDCMIGQHLVQDEAGRHMAPCTFRNWILFANPLDGGPAWPGESRTLIVVARDQQNHHGGIEVAGCGTCRWHRSGDTFETLSMTPSVDAHACGHFTLTNGVFR